MKTTTLSIVLKTVNVLYSYCKKNDKMELFMDILPLISIKSNI